MDQSEINKNFYGRDWWLRAFGTDKVLSHNDIYSAILKIFKDAANIDTWSNKRVLDYGCAFGGIVEYLREYNSEAYGLDVSEWALTNSICPKYVKFCDFENNKIPFEESFFDYITSVEVLEHLDVAKLDFALSEIKRVIKSGGLFMCTISPNPCDEAGHKNAKSRGWWIEKFKEFDFSYIPEFYEKTIGNAYANGNGWNIYFFRKG